MALERFQKPEYKTFQSRRSITTNLLRAKSLRSRYPTSSTYSKWEVKTILDLTNYPE